LFSFKQFKIQSLEALTSAICNHKNEPLNHKILGQHVDTTLMIMFTKN